MVRILMWFPFKSTHPFGCRSGVISTVNSRNAGETRLNVQLLTVKWLCSERKGFSKFFELSLT